MTGPDRHPRAAHPDRTARPRPAGLRRWLPATVLAALMVLVGCKSREGERGGVARGSDPLVVGPGRIPKQNLPVPDRGTAGGRTKPDPLIGAPAGRPGERNGAGYSEDPDRWKGPYLPSDKTTPAALAARLRDDGDGLKIETPPGVPLTPTGGSFPTSPEPAGGSDPLLAELARYGVKRDDYTLRPEGGRFEFRARVPFGGVYHGYVGTGPTEAAAIKDALDQIKADGPK